MKISLYNVTTDKTILLESKKVVIGRDFFSSTDKRIARIHGQITVMDTEIKVRATHTNPIFYKASQPEFKILLQNEEISLGNGHFFSLLPNEHVYEIRVTDENLAGNPETTTTSSDSEIIIQRSDSQSSSNRSTPELDIPQPSSSSSGIKRPANEDANEDTNKRMKNNEPLNIKPDPDEPANEDINKPSTLLHVIKSDPDGADNQSSNQSSLVLPVIKPDPDGADNKSSNQPSLVLPVIKPDPDGASSSTNSTSATTVKTEPGSANNSTSSVSTPVTPTIRVVCQYGIRCYRNTPDHRRNFAHPGDSDYRRPDFLPGPDTAPDCEYGASCYRRNPQHFSDFQHLPPNTYQTPPRGDIIIAQLQRNIDINFQLARNIRPDRGLFVVNYEDDHVFEDVFDDYGSDVDEDYQRERNDMTSSDDEENNCEE